MSFNALLQILQSNKILPKTKIGGQILDGVTIKGPKKGQTFFEEGLVELARGGGGVGGVPTTRDHGRGILSILLRRNRPKI